MAQNLIASILGLVPGDNVPRRDLHAALGGQTQSGISPSTREPVILLFTNPYAGEGHGYFDGWDPDTGLYRYTGEGQRGPQEMRRGNKAIRDHVADGRQLHLFFGERKGDPVKYVGQFQYARHDIDEAPETGGRPLRPIFYFLLRPVGDTASGMPLVSLPSPPPATSVEEVAPEEHNTERYYLDRSSETTTAEKREATLVVAYRQWAAAHGSRLVRHRIAVAGELKPLFTDLCDPERNILIEAKGTTTRDAIRMAIGQLSDYGRFLSSKPAPWVLLPEHPRRDLKMLLHTNGIGLITPIEGGFEEFPASLTSPGDTSREVADHGPDSATTSQG